MLQIDLVDELKLAPPYLLKLDIQGSEVRALKGAQKMLRTYLKIA